MRPFWIWASRLHFCEVHGGLISYLTFIEDEFSEKRTYALNGHGGAVLKWPNWMVTTEKSIGPIVFWFFTLLKTQASIKYQNKLYRWNYWKKDNCGKQNQILILQENHTALGHLRRKGVVEVPQPFEAGYNGLKDSLNFLDFVYNSELALLDAVIFYSYHILRSIFLLSYSDVLPFASATTPLSCHSKILRTLYPTVESISLFLTEFIFYEG